jgi:hypothetical protein
MAKSINNTKDRSLIRVPLAANFLFGFTLLSCIIVIAIIAFQTIIRQSNTENTISNLAIFVYIVSMVMVLSFTYKITKLKLWALYAYTTTMTLSILLRLASYLIGSIQETFLIQSLLAYLFVAVPICSLYIRSYRLFK